MTTGRSQQRAQPRLIATGRGLVASLAMLSLLSVLLPLGRASANSSVKACCIGKAGHESGSCSTGLLASANQARVEIPINPSVERISFSIERTANKKKPFANVKGGAGAAGHCSLHATVSDDSEIEVSGSASATADEADVIEADSALLSNSDEEQSAASRVSAPPDIHAVSSTCPNECGMCSVSYTRRPRPREQSAQYAAVRPPSTSLIRLIVCDGSLVRELNLKWSQAPPRAPPALFV